jgi:two-component system LytT family response regulator
MNEFFIPTNKGVKIVWPQNIIRVEARSNYCRIYFDNDYPLTVAKVLHWFEKSLPNDSFFRIHRTHIVNRNFISEFSGGNTVTLLNGEQLQVSRRKKEALKFEHSGMLEKFSY